MVGDLSPAASVGFALSPEQRAAMTSSLRILKRDYRLERVHLWGRIAAHQRDYYIAVGYPEDSAATVHTPATLFVSQSLTKWAQLPAVSEPDAQRCRSLTGAFVGDLGYEYRFREEVMAWEGERPKRYDEDGEEIESESEEEEEEEEAEAASEDGGAGDPLGGRFKPVPKRKPRRRRYAVTEEVRLAHTVSRISEDCSVVPRGAFAIDQADRVRPNTAFEGLSGRDAMNLSFYLHLRKPKVVPKKTLHERYNANLVYDFLDRLDEDEPRGQWAVRAARNGARVEIRSLLWPGYFAWHAPGTQEFGGVYNGTGQIASDMGFMI